jgi:hypothetical protein
MSVLCADKKWRRAILRDESENVFLPDRRQSLELHLHESVHIGTSIQKFLNDICVAALTSDKKRSSAIDRRAVNSRARLQEKLCDVEKTALCRKEERCRSSLWVEKLIRNPML